MRFDNGSDLTMSVNGAYFQVHQLMFDNGTGARTMTARDSGGIDMRTGSSTTKIENNDADAQVLMGAETGLEIGIGQRVTVRLSEEAAEARGAVLKDKKPKRKAGDA